MRVLEEPKAVGSSYPLWCMWPGADGAAPPGGEKKTKVSVQPSPTSPLQEIFPEGPRAGENGGPC